MDRLINIAQFEIAVYTEAILARENPSIVADQANYSLPDDWIKTVSVQYQIAPTTGNEIRLLSPISREDYLAVRVVPTSSHPTRFAIMDDNLYIYPTPTGTNDEYLHTYVQQPDELVNDTDSLFKGRKHLIPYHSKAADLVINMLIGRNKNISTADVVEAFVPTMERMKQKLNRQFRPGSVQVRRMYSAGTGEPPLPRLPSNY